MTDYAALNRELERGATEKHVRRSEYAERRKQCKALMKQVKAELPKAIQRQREAGWPHATPERVVVPSYWRSSRTVGLTLICGEPLDLPLDFNGQKYGFWLGDDGRLYGVNSFMWIDPKPNMEPYWKLELHTIYDVNKLEQLLNGLKAL